MDCGPKHSPGGGGGTGGIGGTDGGDGRDGQKGAGGKGQGVKVGEVNLQHFVLFPGKGGQPTGQDDTGNKSKYTYDEKYSLYKKKKYIYICF